ncbi:MAG TPA: M3 family oligoendopeptidase [Chloroflexia bacterium]|nr:M3 family oligoendopeptidase [Chloroflexia bacterium]
MTSTVAAALPHWDLSGVYPGLQSPEFTAGFQEIIAEIDRLVALFDTQEVGQQPPTPLDGAGVTAFETVVTRYNAVLARVHTLQAYIQSFVATNSRDNRAQARHSELQRQQVRLAQLNTRFTAWIGALDGEALLAQSPLARDHAFMLERARLRAAHLMSPPEEALAAELVLTGSTAWTKLYENVTSQLMVPVELDGATRALPMPAVRNLAYEGDRTRRRQGYEAELQAWAGAAVPIAAALNGIQGEVNTLAARRQWDSPLAASLFNSNIDRETLEAMLSAAVESFADFRRYLHAKARLLGVPHLAWYDLFAPVGTSTRVWKFDQAADFIVAEFGTYSPRLQDFAARAFRERWIDAEPRPGKRDGAFCMWVRADESRILANFKPAFGGMSTLAHELGHGYHNLNLAGCTMLQRTTPMTLAETASIFCETIIRQAGLAHAGPAEQIAILEASLAGHCQVVVDISCRFRFEQAAFTARQARELSVDELNALMLDAQRQTYGDGLDPAYLHPYMWAAKGHYYSGGRSFYNYPYMFGLLFGLGLYARYQQDPGSFRARYDELLASTGLADAAALAARFDIDIRTPDFWRASLAVIRADIDRFTALVAESAK